MDFSSIDWSFIMDTAVTTIVASLVAVAGTIIVNWFGNRKGYRNIDNKIGSLGNTTLSGQHSKITEDLKNAVEDRSKEINAKIGTLDDTTLSGQNKGIIKKVENISHFLEKENEKKLLNNNLLGYDVQKINSSIENLSGFADIMKNLSSENSKLKAENYNIKNENHKLSQENKELKQQLSQYLNPTYTNNSTQEMSSE